MRRHNWLLLALVPLLGVVSSAVSAQARADPVYQGKNLKEWLAGLKDAKVENRVAAVQAIAVFGPREKVIAALSEALTDNSDTVVLSTAQALGQFGPKARKALAAVRKKFAALGKDSPMPNAAKDGLAQASLVDTHKQTRRAVADALVLIDDNPGPELAPILLEILKDENAQKRRRVVERLGKLGPDAAKTTVPALMQTLADNDKGVRLEAAKALGVLGPAARPALHALTLALKKAAPEKVARVQTLDVSDKPAGTAGAKFSTLRFTLESGDKEMLNACVDALGRIRPNAEGPAAALRAVLHDLDDGVRWAAICALLETNLEVKDVPILESLLRDKEAVVRAAALKALGKSKAPMKQILINLTTALKDSDPGVREISAIVLGDRGGEAKAAAPALLADIKDKQAKVRAAVVRAIGRVGLPDEEVVPILLNALKDDDDDIFAAAFKGLGRLGPRAKAAIPQLQSLLNHAKPERRIGASLVLSTMGPAARDAVPALEKTSRDDSSPSVRLLALAALAKIDRSRLKESLPRLTAALKSKDEEQLLMAQFGLLLLGRDAIPSLRAFRGQVSDKELREGIDNIIEAIHDPKKSILNEFWE